MSDARITISQDHTDRLGNLLFGSWWWMSYADGVGSKSGFARSELRARAKAERAVRKLARTPGETRFRYTVPLDTKGGEAQ